MSLLKKIDTWDERRFKSDAEYVKKINDVEIWKCKNGYRLFACRDGQWFYAGAFYPLSDAEEKARKEK